jgi:WD repeat-containing protein 40A
MKASHENIQSLDNGYGVRSVQFNRQILSIGGGYGRISFYDMRMNRYLETSETSHTKYLQTSLGWLNRDTVYHHHFQGMEIRNAIYTHKYDPTGSRLLAAGGPLQLGLYGNYAAIWS